MSQALIAALQNPALYPHPVEQFQVIETHISWVLLTGEYAYKIKKPMNFGFLDFTSLDQRQHFCNEELRLNQRLTEGLYLDVLPITGSAEAPKEKQSLFNAFVSIDRDGVGELIRIAIAQAQPLGGFDTWRAALPITLLMVRKP